MNKFIVSALLVGAAVTAQAASAAAFFEGNSPAIDNKVKAFSDASHPDNGASVFGITTTESALVKFTGNTTVHVTSGSGYAQINDPTVNASPWNTLTIALDNYAFGFNAIEFSLQFNNADVSNQNPGTLTVTANFLSGLPEVFLVSDFKNPANRSFYLTASPGQVFKSIILSSGSDRLDQVKQVDITLAAAPPPAVPEPASWALMIAGMAVTGAAMRRRAKNVQFA
ncbi:PEPxxWA-CTERM sorting domain-containing protein [Sphingobium nicotianae]|uniref:PEPxxWA-CTERM sorting domain-containing protein n=1 Tax=Sphingobium nicotianae TaxID=2782607 RepID=A0A9X1IT51_9SPHN|nr:PEPxxWA-CTERM sorting domain-containing protein [Sphingobium nicotianae]MBT2188967.1 PEPxxWA-CTERM sorting domain-containing protein [Sphingobium nicotianae]